MIIAIVHHWCKPDKVDAAREHIDHNGDKMATAPGFLFRYRIEPPGDPLKVSTVTAWADETALQAYRAANPPADPADPDRPFARIENETFVVRHAHGDKHM